MLGNRGIARLEAGAATASLGTWAFSIALALYAYYEDGPGGVALAVAVRMLPSALVAPLVDRAVDSYPRRGVLVASALAAFVLLEGVTLVAVQDLPFALLLGLAAGFEVAASAARAARAAMLLELART
jgi:MFS family permease